MNKEKKIKKNKEKEEFRCTCVGLEEREGE